MPTATATDVGGELSDQIARVQIVFLHHIVTDRNGQRDFASGLAAKHAKEWGVLGLELKRQVLDVFGVQIQDGTADLDAIDGLQFRDQIAFDVACGFAL